MLTPNQSHQNGRPRLLKDTKRSVITTHDAVSDTGDNTYLTPLRPRPTLPRGCRSDREHHSKATDGDLPTRQSSSSILPKSSWADLPCGRKVDSTRRHRLPKSSNVRLLDHRDVSAPNLFDVKIIVKRCAPASVITIIIGHEHTLVAQPAHLHIDAAIEGNMR
jgi:hypothetical protein